MKISFYYYVGWFAILLISPLASCVSYAIPEASTSTIPAALPSRLPVVIPSVPRPSQPTLPSYSAEPASPASAPIVTPRVLPPVVMARRLAVIAKRLWMSKQLRINTRRLLLHSATIRRITIHHTATPQSKNAASSLRGMQRYHIMEKGWADIAYHYLIAADGKIYEGRNAYYVGSSSTDYELDNNLMIALIGNFEKYPPSEQALSALKNLVADKLAKYKLQPNNVYTHGEQVDTLCPGRYLKAWYSKQGKRDISRQFYRQ